MLRDYFSLAFKNLRHRGIRSWLTLLGIFIGIVAVISLITLGNGLKMAVNSQFGAASLQSITVQAGGLNSYGPPGTGVTNPLTKEDAEAIEKISSVEVALARNIKPIKIEFNDILEISYALSLPEGKLKYAYELNDLTINEGRLLKEGELGRVVIGNDLSDKEKSGFGKLIKVGDTINIQEKKFEVIGVLEKKGSFILDKTIFIQDDDLNNLLNYGEEADIIGVKVKSKDLVKRAKEDIEKLMRERRDVKVGEEDFTVETPEATLATVNTILGGIQAFIVIIAFISILVGAIGIVNTMTTSVLERKKEIGTMKSIGATNTNIFMQFLVESGLLGLIGGMMGVVVGILIGYLGTVGINSFVGSTAKPQIDVMLIILTLICSFLVGSIAGIAPAMQAAKQNPVEALRG